MSAPQSLGSSGACSFCFKAPSASLYTHSLSRSLDLLLSLSLALSCTRSLPLSACLSFSVCLAFSTGLCIYYASFLSRFNRISISLDLSLSNSIRLQRASEREREGETDGGREGNRERDSIFLSTSICLQKELRENLGLIRVTRAVETRR